MRQSGVIPRAGAGHSVAVELVAVLAAVTQGEPRVLTTHEGQALPSGPFEVGHRSLQAGLRAWVEQQTHHPLGYVEQLYTFADSGRYSEQGAAGHAISISYLALTRETASPPDLQARWHGWYRYFPWEDHRHGTPAVLGERILPALRAWIAAGEGEAARQARAQRAALTFGLDGYSWNEDRILQRYELLYEMGLVAEAAGGQAGAEGLCLPGVAMRYDHRRILATGIARLRAKIKYRPVVFELMPADFTLLQLQQSVQALAGRNLHKQNFRRLIEQQELVEETGEVMAGATGRPAKLFRFRRGVMLERAISGSKLPVARH
ncbi:hypothetical protein V8Z80_09670 [Orrella sp. JC864]|uniref:NUDIX hydrolase n=1 Tax=Orrella sp. JC864 TaxID=3120298 RepID=UPI003008035B